MEQPFTTPGIVAADTTPTSEDLYVSVEELRTQFGFTATEAQIRTAQVLINGYCNRRSLWPETYEETLDLPSDRNQTILAARPVLRLLSAQGRYSYGRRDRRTLNSINYDYVAALAVFGSPPAWMNLDINQVEVLPASGEVFLPTGFFLVNYSQVRLSYLSGFVDMPYRMKLFVALTINEICAKGSADRTSYSVGRVSRTFANPSFIPQDVRSGLQPFCVRA